MSSDVVPSPQASSPQGSPLPADLVGFLLDAVTDLFFTLDPDLRFTYVNDRVVEAVGIGRVALLGRRLTDLFPEIRGTDAERRFRDVPAAGRPAEFELHHEAWDRWLAYRASPVPGGLAVLARDVTDQKRAEAVLLESDERFRVALEAADLGTWTWSPGTDVIWCDDRAAAVIGAGPDDGPASAEWLLRSAVHPDDSAAVSRALAGAIDPRGPGQLRCEFRLAGPAERWVQLHGRTLFEERGDVRRADRVVGTAQDVTDRRLGDRAVRAARDELQYVADTMPCAVGRCSRDRRFVWVNRRYAERFDLAPEQMVGRHIGEFFSPEDLARFAPQVERVLAGEPHTYEAPVAVPALGMRWWHCVYAPTRDAAGAVDGWISAVTDITDRRELEDALRVSEGLHRAFGDAAIDFIWQCAPDGTTLYANRAWQVYTGLTVDAFNQVGLSSVCHPDDLAAAAAAWERAVAVGGTYDTQFRFRRCDGAYRWFLVRAAPVRDAGGAVARWVGISTDVQRMRETEEQLAEAKRDAEAASAAKDRFLAVLSHELRTPLTPVSIGVSMLEMHPDLSAEVRADLAMIRRNIELETRLIDDLLDVTRIAHGKIRLSPRDVSAHDLVREVLDNCQPDARGKRVEVTAALKAADDRLHGDPARLQQAVWNLLKNAIKFTPPGGRVTVRTANPTPGTLAVAVEDTGVGIPPDAIGRLFNAFEQVGPAGGGSDPQAGGLGLGLAIARALAEVHGGRATAHSAGLGRGATFTIELPTRGETPTLASVSAPESRGPLLTNAPPAGRGPDPTPDAPLRVLLVDDHEDTLRIMQRLLKVLGCDVTAVGHAHDALDAAAAEPFDLLVSDVGLPDVNGRELMRRVKAAHNLPGIAVSGYGTDNDIRSSHDAGFEAHLTKPVNFDDLQAALARVGRRARA